MNQSAEVEWLGIVYYKEKVFSQNMKATEAEEKPRLRCLDKVASEIDVWRQAKTSMAMPYIGILSITKQKL